jgi:hypothetical protein
MSDAATATLSPSGPLYRSDRHLAERCCWRRGAVCRRRSPCWRTSPVRPHFVGVTAGERSVKPQQSYDDLVVLVAG